MNTKDFYPTNFNPSDWLKSENKASSAASPSSSGVASPSSREAMPHASRPLLRPCKPPTWTSRLPTTTGSMSASPWPTRLGRTAARSSMRFPPSRPSMTGRRQTASTPPVCDRATVRSPSAPFSIWPRSMPSRGATLFLCVRFVRCDRQRALCMHAFRPRFASACSPSSQPA